jgi:hypothetical protein
MEATPEALSISSLGKTLTGRPFRGARGSVAAEMAVFSAIAAVSQSGSAIIISNETESFYAEELSRPFGR